MKKVQKNVVVIGEVSIVWGIVKEEVFGIAAGGVAENGNAIKAETQENNQASIRSTLHKP